MTETSQLGRQRQAVPIQGLPGAVEICEVSPRDGLQNEPVVIPLETKLELISRLLGAGLRTVEVTSLVRPDWVPQLADADELLARLERPKGAHLVVLVPNLRGLERAMAASVRDIAVFAERDRVVRDGEPAPQPPRLDGGLPRGRLEAPSALVCECAVTCRCASATRSRGWCRSAMSSASSASCSRWDVSR